jgi:hypothetical protein
LSSSTTVSSNASGTNVSVTMPYGMNTYAIRSGTTTITTTNLLAACIASTTWNGTTCAPTVPSVTPPSLGIDVEKNFVRRGGKSNVDFTVNSSANTTCTITGVQTTPIVFNHSGATSSAVYSYTTRVLNASQKIVMNCVTTGIDDTSIEGRVNVIPSLQEY